MKPVVLAPLVALALAAGGAGAYLWLSSGGSTEEIVAQPTPTPTTTVTTVPSLTATAVASPTATPLPSGKAPEGCTSTEKAYVDPDGRFAFCYPADMELVTDKSGEGQGVTVMDPIEQENRIVATWGWVSQGRVGLVPDAPCISSPTITKNQAIEESAIAGKMVKVCFQDHYDRTRPEMLLYKSIQMEVPAKSGGVVQIEVASFGPDWIRNDTPSQELVTRLLQSASLD